MKFLVLDTSTDNLSWAAFSEAELIFKYTHQIKRGSSKAIAVLEKLLTDYKLKVKDFDAFFVGSGPGSFTGLRISFSIVKAFGCATGKPVIAVSSFATMAYKLRKQAQKIAVVTDARRGFFYTAAYRINKDKLIRKQKEKLSIPQEFIEQHRDYLYVSSETPVLDKLAKEYPDLQVHQSVVWPDLFSLRDLGRQLYLKGGIKPLTKLEPLYIYPKDCQVKKHV
jgi:tRNA threonylcarbamoyl adenosine modification protein YeaZ